MLKKILEKRVEQFKTDFPEFQVSKKTGSLYARIGVHEIKKDVKYTGRAITKGTVSKLGTKIQWVENKSSYVYLLTPKGRLMVSKGGGNFGGVTLKNISRGFTDLRSVYFIGKKFEWLKEYPSLWDYKFFQGFNSLSEAKKFLGFSFISDADFAGLFLLEYHFDFLSPMILAKDKKNVVKLYKNLDTELMDSIRDYIEMCQDNGFEVEIPASKNRLEELHSEDYYIIKTNMGYYVSQCHFYNGAWYSNLGLKVKMTSVLSISFAEILGAEIGYKGTTLKGKITKVIDGNLGVFWYQGGDYKKYGMPYFFNNVENLEI